MLINEKNKLHIITGLGLLRQDLLESKGKPLSNYSPELIKELDGLIEEAEAYEEKPHVTLVIGVEDEQMGVLLARSDGVGDEYEQAYVKMVADSLNQSLDLIIPPDNVGFAVLRIEDMGNNLKFEKIGICGAQNGHFRDAVTDCTNVIFKYITKGG